MATSKTTVKQKVARERKARGVAPKKSAPKKRDYLYAVGRRKTAVARVRRLAGGVGEITVNEKPLNEYFPEPELHTIVKSPIDLVAADERFAYTVKVQGGGKHSQAEAVRHGIARVLLVADPEHRKALKQAGWLTRDARVKERKKPGLKRARRAPQWQKR
ncbi:MAG: 30S ribosomal protein S9 [Candidatus Nomurabacteria bacterium]|nr:MAG: 30S ribosomal protein S9 [Candidatus Nomurabacteria bacterium]